jgi:hypothetical protein
MAFCKKIFDQLWQRIALYVFPNDVLSDLRVDDGAGDGAMDGVMEATNKQVMQTQVKTNKENVNL